MIYSICMRVQKNCDGALYYHYRDTQNDEWSNLNYQKRRNR